MELESLCRIVSSGTTPQVAGPEGRLREVGDFSNPRSARDGKKEWGLGVSGSPKTTKGDLKPSLFFPSTPKGWLKVGEKVLLKVPFGRKEILPLYYRKWGKIKY